MEIDRELVDRLETTGARLNAQAADALTAAGAQGASPAVAWGGGVLIAFGPGRYVNRLCGLGTADVAATAATEIEVFFGQRGVAPCIEVTPWASPSLLQLLRDRRYAPSAFRNVYVRAAEPVADSGRPSGPAITIEPVSAECLDRWLAVMAVGVGAGAGSARRTSDEYCRARFSMPHGRNFIASIDGLPVGCGSLEMADGVAWLGGMATVPAHRGRGVQAALIRHRVALAADAGADLIASSAVPEGVSARNLLRHGFQLAYSRLEATR